jgi:hypothetical protein
MNEIFTVSSLTNVIAGATLKRETKGSMLKNEVFSFQVVYRYDWCAREIDVTIDSPIKKFVSVRMEEIVPVTTPNTWAGDDFVLSKEPFLLPDVLVPIEKRRPTGRYNTYSVLWFTVKGDLPVGTHDIVITLDSGGNKLTCKYKLTVVDAKLEEVDFKYTRWFHYDGIAQYYNLPVFSPEYNKIMDNFIKCAVNHGQNMLLVPMFTPPLDTRIGSERLTVQLVDVEVKNGKYVFDLERLVAFMKHIKKLGIKYFELSHLFTQWGAKAAPKIMAKKNGKLVQIMGWDTPTTGAKYKKFLSEFLPTLRARLIKEKLFKSCYFHLSDEPSDKTIEDYSIARNIFKQYVPDGIVMDALSHYDFYERGLVDRPVSGTDAVIREFIANNVQNMWVYYCCGQCGGNLSNVIMAFPAYRNRVLGVQLYMNQINGFLQWGYNFYNSVLSDEPVNPYFITDCGGGLQSGDGFIVYPGKKGPYDSIRHEVFFEALQDMRLFCTLEKKIGRAKTEALLEKYGFKKSFTEYPHEPEALMGARKEAQRLLARKK